MISEPHGGLVLCFACLCDTVSLCMEEVSTNVSDEKITRYIKQETGMLPSSIQEPGCEGEQETGQHLLVQMVP